MKNVVSVTTLLTEITRQFCIQMFPHETDYISYFTLVAIAVILISKIFSIDCTLMHKILIDPRIISHSLKYFLYFFISLQAELIDILKNMFLPSKKMIKEQLEWLIEHKYMRRDDDDINTFIYMA